MHLVYYYCEVSYLNNFSCGGYYIRVSNSESTGKGIYLNGKHELECVSDYCFHKIEEKVSIADVYAIYDSEDGSVITGNKYGVYKIDSNGNYFIFTEKFRFEYLPKSWFISTEEWMKSSTYEKKEIIEKSKYACSLLDNTTQKNKSNIEDDSFKKEQKKKLEVVSAVSRKIAENTGVSVTKIISYLPKKIYFMMILIVVANTLFAFVTKNVLFGIVAVWLFITAITGRKSEKKVIDKEIKIDLSNYERLNSMNKLSLNMLGKIKQIENYMTIMRYRGVNEEIILLVEQSINLTVFTTIQDDYYSSNKEEIDERLNKFLDNTLEYIKTSLQNKDMEIYQIKKNLSEDYLKMIDRNSEMFKSITKDLGQLSNIFGEEKSQKKEEPTKTSEISEK